MPYRDSDSEIDGEYHFLPMPREWLEDFGRLAILSGRIEMAAYEIARGLGIRRPQSGRSRPFRQECDAIHERLSDPWLPPRVAEWRGGQWRMRTLDWLSTAPSAMDVFRNGVLHRAYFSLGHDGKWKPAHFSDRRDLGSAVLLSASELEDAIRALILVDRQGLQLWTEMPDSPVTGAARRD